MHDVINSAASSPDEEKLRYGFGKNWKRFLAGFSERRLSAAQASLQKLLMIDSLSGKTFLDIGSGSGLFSLAALRLGAKQVVSFDYDQNSVDCALYLREKFGITKEKWEIYRGSILDQQFVAGLPKSEVVYSWGVLHHTGNMWRALELASETVAGNGTLAIAIYNDQGVTSSFWKIVKKLYNRGVWFQIPLIVFFQLSFGFIGLIADLFYYRRNPIKRYRNYGDSARGMNRFTDLLDWLGGYPFEVAKPEEIFKFFRDKGFELTNLKTVSGRLGCNEFVFKKVV